MYHFKYARYPADDHVAGRRRDIPSWAIAALWGLAELSSLSLAQSLFFVILTITPYPATATQHGARWTPHVHVYLVPVGIASLSTGFLPGLTSNDAGWIADTGSRLSTLFLATGIKVSSFYRASGMVTPSSAQSTASIYRCHGVRGDSEVNTT